MMNKREDFIKTMDDYLSLVDEKASQYRQDIINKETEKIRVEAIKNLSKNLNIDYIKAMDLLNIFKDEYDKYLELIKE